MKLSPLFLMAALLAPISAQSLAANMTVEEDQKQQQVIAQRVNINHADVEALTQLKGIGKGKALAIIAFREENGAFSSVEEITQVKGIGDKLFQKIVSNIRVK